MKWSPQQVKAIDAVGRWIRAKGPEEQQVFRLFEAHIVGEMTAPAIGTGDLLVVVSCTGRTRTIVAQAEAAKAAGARLAVLTSSPRSKLAKAADLVVWVKASKDSIQFGGTLFEQALFVYLDAVVLLLGSRLGARSEELLSRHSNLE